MKLKNKKCKRNLSNLDKCLKKDLTLKFHQKPQDLMNYKKIKKE